MTDAALEPNKDVVRRWFDAMSNHGSAPLATIRDLLAEDARWWFLQNRNWVEGRDTIVQLVTERIPRAFPDGMRFETEHYTAEDDRVAVLVRSDAQTRAGQHYQNCYHFFFRLRDGLIVEIREYMDTKHAHELVYRAG